MYETKKLGNFFVSYIFLLYVFRLLCLRFFNCRKDQSFRIFFYFKCFTDPGLLKTRPYSAGRMLASKTAYSARNSAGRIYPSLLLRLVILADTTHFRTVAGAIIFAPKGGGLFEGWGRLLILAGIRDPTLILLCYPIYNHKRTTTSKQNTSYLSVLNLVSLHIN